MNNLIFVAVGSMAGGVARYLLSDFIQRQAHLAFPIGVLVVNVAGCFVMGLIAGLLAHSALLSNTHRLLLAVGFCGSFTTFSTFSLDNLQLLTAKSYLLLSLNVGLSVVLGLLATWAGHQLVQSFAK